ncbi:hypothetical protein NIES39_D05240 [Arthrospira platensis NIES-39]|uniref:hypothetical protein n=1 Tax=Limnospira platensis TaxID=118562 RepID=UPI0001D0E449|nr:hypothetical protein NIES39_D05240 [Arthrospira platensis NIES-39]
MGDLPVAIAFWHLTKMAKCALFIHGSELLIFVWGQHQSSKKRVYNGKCTVNSRFRVRG